VGNYDIDDGWKVLNRAGAEFHDCNIIELAHRTKETRTKFIAKIVEGRLRCQHSIHSSTSYFHPMAVHLSIN
jgi:hypothetical protein